MKIAIIGTGHVGFTGLCCPADQGHEVVGFDVSRARVEAVRADRAPITEPQVQAILDNARAAGRISARETLPGHIDGCDIAIVRVGPPSGLDGAHDMRHIAASARPRRRAAGPARHPLTVVYRSTVRPGTMQGMVAQVHQKNR